LQHIELDNQRIPSDTAQMILSSKYKEWEYEKEVRILSENQWYKLQNPVRRIIVGHRMNPSLFEALRIVCEHKRIVLDRTVIGNKGINAIAVT
jgi:hypothetical protein